jgi:hypothetical protein
MSQEANGKSELYRRAHRKHWILQVRISKFIGIPLPLRGLGINFE